MPWYNALGFGRRAIPDTPVPASLTAAAMPVKRPEQQFLQQTSSWQEEAWRYYDELGEFNTGVNWLAAMMSRVRLRAAELQDDTDEPKMLGSGPAADVIGSLSGGVGGQSQLMRAMTIQASVPGDCYLVGQDNTEEGHEDWTVRSSDEVRVQNRKFQVVSDRFPTIVWSDLPPDSMPVRVWKPHARYYHLADSVARAALPIMRELELVNRHIVAQYLSRLASAGILLLPNEVEFPVREEFADAPDPFTAEFVEIAMEAIRQPGTASAVVPIPIKVPAEYVDKIKHIDFTLKMDEKIIDKRSSAVNRLANKLDIPAEILTGRAQANHWCVDDQTEILTKRGWLREGQLTVGDIALTLNHETGMSEWQEVSYVYRAPVVDEPMVSIERQSHSSLTTPHHRWPIVRNRKSGGVRFSSREFVHSEDLGPLDRITTGAPNIDVPSDPKYTDDLVELVAWLWTEGSVRDGRSVIAQSHTVNPQRVDRIRSALTRMYGPASVRRINPLSVGWRESVQPNENSYGGPVTVFHLNQRASAVLLEHGGKFVNTSFIRQLTRSQLELFIDVSCQGDGWHYRSGRLDIWQKDRKALEAYELALILSGRPVSLRRSGGGWNCSPSKNRTTVQPMKSSGGRYETEVTEYTGTVWCPVTPNSTWFARRNGTSYYTGNTAWVLDEDALKTHIAPTAETICDSLTRGYLWPRLKASGMSAKEYTKYVVWYDMSELAQRPDKSANAEAAYDRMELSGEALRREGGFDEDDAPTPEEVVEMALKALVRNNPGDAASALNALAGKDVLGVPEPTSAASPNATGGPVAAPEETPRPKEPGPPEMPQGAPKGPPKAAVDRAVRTAAQMRAMHAIQFGVGVNGDLLHPQVCREHAYSCPFTHAAMGSSPPRLTTGTYECRLDPFGRLSVGAPAPYLDTSDWIATPGLNPSRRGGVGAV